MLKIGDLFVRKLLVFSTEIYAKSKKSQTLSERAVVFGGEAKNLVVFWNARMLRLASVKHRGSLSMTP
ncbi:MAG: hypothetical protein ACE14M_07570 [Terriglobales bacterium]